MAPGLWKLDTDLYEIRVRALSPHSGKMLSRWRQFRGTMAEALAERELLQGRLRGELVEPKARETVTDFARSWLSTRLARGDWRETTAQRYVECLELRCRASARPLSMRSLRVMWSVRSANGPKRTNAPP